MLDFARATFPAPNITYSIGDARTVGDNPDWQERFDKAVSFFVIHWFPDHLKAFESILACLKPGGEALVTLVGRDPFPPEIFDFITSHEKWGIYVKVIRLRLLKQQNC